jgi:uncharacterized DUF497 family protein
LHSEEANLPHELIVATIRVVDVTFDAAKDAENIRKHGISLQRSEDFDFAAADYQLDDREDYGEVRFRAVSFLDAKLYSLIFSPRGESVRAISLRKATKQEQNDYA